MLAAVLVMFLLSGPRGRSRYYPLGFGIILAVLSLAYAVRNREFAYYAIAALALAKGVWDYRRWHG